MTPRLAGRSAFKPVGYGAEAARARALLRAHPVVVVEGLAGAGKTTFLGTLARLAAKEGRRTFEITVERDWSLDTFAVRLEDVLAGRSLPGRVDSGLSPGERLARLVDLIEGGSCLVLIDDLDQVRGTGPAALLESLVKGLSGSRVVASSRQHLRPGRRCGIEWPTIVLRGLAREDALRLLRGTFERGGVAPPPVAVLERVHERVSGHPLSLRIIAAHMLRRGDGDVGPGEPADAAVPAATAILPVLGELDADERALLHGIACFRLPVPREALHAFGAPEGIDGALARLLDRFLVESPAPDLYAVHPAVREQCRAAAPLDALEVRAVHRTAVAYCRERARGDGAVWAAELHHHLIEAGEGEDARRQLLDGMATLRKNGAPMVGLIDRTLEVLGRDDPELLLAKAEALLGEHCIEDAEPVVARLAPLGKHATIGPRVRLVEGRLFMARERRDDARRALAEALVGFASGRDLGRMAETLSHVAHLLVVDWKPAEALAACRRCLELALRAGDRERAAQALRMSANAHLRLGRLTEAERLYERALELDEAEGRTGAALLVLRQIVTIQAKMGRLDEAIRLCEQALDRARKEGHRLAQAKLLTALAQIRFDAGDPERALPHLEEARELFGRLSHRIGQGAADLGIAECRAELGDLDSAERLTREVIDGFGKLGDRGTAELATINLAYILNLQGRYADALEAIDPRTSLLAAGEARDSYALALHVRSLALGGLGRLKEARADCLEAARIFRKCERKPRALAAELDLAAFECRSGRRAEAARRCRDVLREVAQDPAHRFARIIAWRLLDAAEHGKRRARAPVPDARSTWTAEFRSAPRAVRGKVASHLRLHAIAFPDDYLLRTGSSERAATIAEVCEVLDEPSRYALVIDVAGARVFRRPSGWIAAGARSRVLDLLVFLASRPGAALGHDAILRAVWGEDGRGRAARRRLVDQHLHRLRHLLGEDSRRPVFVKAVRREGRYSFSAEACYCLCFRSRDRARVELTPRQRAILDRVESAGCVKCADCAARFEVSAMTARRDLEAMVRAGILDRSGGGPTTHYRLAE